MSVVFDPPIWLKPPGDDTDILRFGKAPEVVADDLRRGIARVGGPHRSPSYLHAYLQAGEHLVSVALETNKLDELALPIIYLQRHVVELLLKRLLGWCHEIAKFRAENSRETWQPTSKQEVRLNTEHSLHLLCDDLAQASTALGYGDVPEALRELVASLLAFESDPTWARYESRVSKGVSVRHQAEEVEMPVVELQRSLRAVVNQSLYNADPAEESLEDRLYGEWRRWAEA